MIKLQHRTSHVVICSLLFIGSVLFLILGAGNPTGRSNPFFFFQHFYQSCQLENQGKVTSFVDELDEALSKASMPNRTVIITVVNKAYIESNNDDKDKQMLDLFLDSFWVGEDTQVLMDHVLIVVTDETAYERCKFLRLHCYKLEMSGDSEGGEKVYMSRDFIEMMWRRTRFLGDVLRRGYDFVFTDTDILWLRNPFPHLSALNQTVDLQISTDKFNGDDGSEKNPINTGFYYVRSNNKTISLFNQWYASRVNATGLKEQDVLDKMMKQGVFRQLGLTVRFLNTRYISGFCQDSHDVKVVMTVHANCCRTISAKLADLTAVVRDWKRFRRLGLRANETMALGAPRHVACLHSWKRFKSTPKV